METTFTPEDVRAFEHATWSRCASGYEDGFALLTRTAVEAVLDAAGVGSGTRVLDVGTGTGVAAATARGRGAEVIGTDFSAAMLAEARRNVPDVEFRESPAEHLPFDDCSFDSVVANGVLHHLGDPPTALHEVHRVLRRGGRFAATVWDAPETLEGFGLFFAAVTEHAGDAELPHGPLFGVTDEDALTGLLRDAGLVDVDMTPLATTWSMPSIDVLLRAFATWAQLDTFPAETRNAIEGSVRERAVAFRTDGGFSVPNPMILLSGMRPT